MKLTNAYLSPFLKGIGTRWYLSSTPPLLILGWECSSMTSHTFNQHYKVFRHKYDRRNWYFSYFSSSFSEFGPLFSFRIHPVGSEEGGHTAGTDYSVQLLLNLNLITILNSNVLERNVEYFTWLKSWRGNQWRALNATTRSTEESSRNGSDSAGLTLHIVIKSLRNSP